MVSLTASLLGLGGIRLLNPHHVATVAQDGLARVTALQSLAGDDTVDLCKEGQRQEAGAWVRGESVPVRMFWKASSTLLASRADVSMKERLFSPVGISSAY